jgi:predicted ATPase
VKIKSIHLKKQFKRFTELQITGIPETAKLVVLVGPNGSGKSSLFDAFNFWIGPVKQNMHYGADYHGKIQSDGSSPYTDNWNDLHYEIQVEFHDGQINPRERTERGLKAFYIRSAYRNEAEFETRGTNSVDDALKDSKRPSLMISPDMRVSDNYTRLVSQIFDEVFDWSKKGSYEDLREKLIGKTRASMLNVFNDLILNSTGNPNRGGTFLFKKGTSQNFKYKNLSGGEKAAFDLLLDFILKSEFFDDTIYCIDEPEVHMNTKLQARLLDELYLQLPANCQLWIATHSLGMMRRAMELYQNNPGEVVFLDFENRDFDASVIMEPAIVDRQFWKRVFNVALDDLAELVAPSEIVFCEGKTETIEKPKDKTFDAEIYRIIFQQTHPDTEFIALGGTSQVETNSLLISNVLKKCSPQ